MNNNAEHDVQVNKLFTFPTFCYDLSSASVLCVLLSDKKKITCLKFSFIFTHLHRLPGQHLFNIIIFAKIVCVRAWARVCVRVWKKWSQRIYGLFCGSSLTFLLIIKDSYVSNRPSRPEKVSRTGTGYPRLALIEYTALISEHKHTVTFSWLTESHDNMVFGKYPHAQQWASALKGLTMVIF